VYHYVGDGLSVACDYFGNEAEIRQRWLERLPAMLLQVRAEVQQICADAGKGADNEVGAQAVKELEAGPNFALGAPADL